MLFTYRNHPVLEKLKTGKIGKTRIYDQDYKLFRPEINYFGALWEKYAPSFRESIKVITKPVTDAMISAKQKLLTEEMMSFGDHRKGTFFIDKMTYCYDFTGGWGDNECVFFMFQEDMLSGACHLVNEEGPVYFTSHALATADIKKLCIGTHGLISMYTNFLKYAPIEVKFVAANKKVKAETENHCNQTDLDIEVIDSTWFTTLVRSEGFKVRGHFRLQPYGPGMTQKRLIWIQDFEKHGYVRNFKRPINIEE